MFRILISVLFLGVTFTASWASKVHFVALFSTKDTEIGSSASVVYEKSATQFRDIATAIGYEFRLYPVKDEAIVGQTSLKSVLANLQTSSDDIIVFHAFTHGFRYRQENTQFPQLLLALKANGLTPENQIGTEDIYRELNHKMARFRLMMIEACNNNDRERPQEINLITMRSMGMPKQPDIERYKDLFLRVKGNVLLGAAKPGQGARTPDNSPSLFFDAFDKSLQKLLIIPQKASWRKLFEELDALMKIKKKDIEMVAKVNVEQDPVCEFRDFVEDVEAVAPTITPTAVAYTFDHTTEEYLRLMKQADQQYSQRSYQNALELYQKALGLKPFDYKAKQGAYLCKAMLGQIDFKELDSKQLCGLLHNISQHPEFQSPQFAFAQYLYGISYIKGKGDCDKDWQKAQQWLRISYKNGMEGACHVWERVDRSRTNAACQNW